MVGRRLGLFVLVALVVAAGVAGFLLSGESAEELRRRWEARVSELRASGAQLEVADFRGPSVPEADNAEGLLRKVSETYDAEWPDGPGPTDYPADYEENDLSPEERGDRTTWWPRLEPLYAWLEEASARPVLVSTADDPFAPPPLIAWIQDAAWLWMLRARYRPKDSECMALQNLRTALAWRPRNHVEVFVRWGHFVWAVQIRRRAVTSGHADLATNGPVLREVLRRAEEGWLDHFRLAHCAARAVIVLGVDCSTGRAEPPMETSALYDCDAPSDAQARRQLYLDALAKLDHIEDELGTIEGEADVRSTPALDWGAELGPAFFTHCACSGVLRMLASLRLARWAIVLEGELAAGRPLTDDLAAYADRFPDGPPLDPATSRLFRWVRRGRGFLLSVDFEAADETLFDFDRSFWEASDDDDSLLPEDLTWLVGGEDADPLPAGR